MSISNRGYVFSLRYESIKLRHGESVTIGNIPEGVSYKVVQSEANKNGYKTIATNDSGTIVAEKTIDIKFVNDKTKTVGIPKTGDLTTDFICISMFAVSGLGLSLLLLKKKSKIN